VKAINLAGGQNFPWKAGTPSLTPEFQVLGSNATFQIVIDQIAMTLVCLQNVQFRHKG
jgi:hypothetical protein